jgi:TetR/AcrR family transcriptional regulator, ethionamide resistance regulator
MPTAARGATRPAGARAYGKAETAILAAVEQLLTERPLNQLTVADIIDAAGISRTSFYAHFTSKTSVVAECLKRLIDQAVVATDPFLSGPSEDPEAAIRVSLERWLQLCKLHGPLLKTVSEEWPHDHELRRLWFDVLDLTTTRTARVLIADRKAGNAPPGANATALAACLMWAYERVLHVALVGGAVGLPRPEAIVEPLTQMVVGGLYGRTLSGRTGTL